MALAGDTPTVALRLPATPESVAAARHATAEFAREVGADPNAVAIAVSETVTNAILHGYREGNEGPIEVTAKKNGTHMILEVADEGHGMAPHPGHQGLGVGLSMVSSLADDVGIESTQGHGTRLRMRFPLG